jgi:predicted metal-dependent hydrolase
MKSYQLLLSGKILRVEFVMQKDKRASVSLDGDKVTVVTKDEAEGRRLIYEWAKRRASLAIKQSVWRQSRTLGIDSYRLVIRDQKTRWGSCSARRTISFNFRIGLAPKEVMDYVVLHELVHLKVMNHSKSFWEEIAKYCPNHKEYERWLRKNALALLNPLKF